MIDLERETISSLGMKMKSGEISARSLTEFCLNRIAMLDPLVNAVIELNPDALEIAERRDRERESGQVRGPLHGLPVMVKDNLNSADNMMTTAGSLALVGSYATADSHVVKRLRDAGAVIIAKTNLSEWANFRSTRSSSGWSSRGGQTRNTYDQKRSPGGSSSGSAVAVAASFCVAAIGTETDGSILGPAAMNSIVGFKPTVGLVSRSGIIPISHNQDTAGPMARTVADAAIVLAQVCGFDQQAAPTKPSLSYLENLQNIVLDKEALKGARIGVARNYAGFHEAVDALFDNAIEDIRLAGAEIMDDLILTPTSEFKTSEVIVMATEFKQGLNNYLRQSVPDAQIKSLEDLIEFNQAHADDIMPWFQQEILELSQSKGDLDDHEYLKALSICKTRTQEQGIDKLMSDHNLDALIAPTTSTPWVIDLINGDNKSTNSHGPAAVAGYPSITVPAGYVHGLPVGISFFSTAWQDAILLNLAYAYEHATQNRVPPAFKQDII